MRMRNAMLAIGAVLVAASAPAQAQTCAAGTTQDACQKAVDFFNFFTPQVSTALTGGAATIGQGGVLGGFPHFMVGVRASALEGQLPQMNGVPFSTSGAVATNIPTDDQLVPMASFDGSLGIYKGFSLGTTRVGGIDLLLTATFIPGGADAGDATVTLSGGKTTVGGGVRVGLLEESLIMPGVSFSYVQRSIPTLSFSGSSNFSASAGSAPGDYALNDLSIKTSSWRVSASKSFLIFGLQGGIGQDMYDNTAAMRVTVKPLPPLPQQSVDVTASNSMTRLNMYGGFSINFIIGKIVAEFGQVSGGSLPPSLNTFGTIDAAASRTYYSVGLRFGL